MMMSERRPDPEAGLLLYLRTSSLQEVQAGINEMRGLVQLRNQLAVHLRDQDKLPDPINLKRACEQCAHLPICAAHQELQVKCSTVTRTLVFHSASMKKIVSFCLCYSQLCPISEQQNSKLIYI